MPTLKQLKYRHTEHQKKAGYWDLLTALVRGAEEVTPEIKEALLPNPDHRPKKIVEERVKLSTYVSKITPIISRFNSELFGKPALPTGSKDTFWEDEFFPNGALLDDDDDGRTSFLSFCQRAMFDALTTGKAIALVDTRKTSGGVNKAQQASTGELNPYVMLLPRSALWDWKAGSNGFIFAKIHQFRLLQDTWDATPIPQHVFTIYQRFSNGVIAASKYIVTKKPKEDGKPPEPKPFIDNVSEDKDVIITADVTEDGYALENLPIFNAGNRFEFPLVTLTLPKPLHMAGQLFELQKSYFAQTAAIDYALYTGNYGILYVNGVENDEDDPLRNNAVGEGYYLALKEGQSINWLERGGGTVSTAINYRDNIKRDIYDLLQQIAMSATDGTSIIGRSGESKREDRRPESLLLETFGVILKDFMLQLMKPAAIAHGENIEWTIVGYSDFVNSGFMDDINDMMGFKNAGIQSATFNRETQKNFVKTVAKGIELTPSQVNKSLKEIDEAPDDKFLPQELPPALDPNAQEQQGQQAVNPAMGHQ